MSCPSLQLPAWILSPPDHQEHPNSLLVARTSPNAEFILFICESSLVLLRRTSKKKILDSAEVQLSHWKTLLGSFDLSLRDLEQGLVWAYFKGFTLLVSCFGPEIQQMEFLDL